MEQPQSDRPSPNSNGSTASEGRNTGAESAAKAAGTEASTPGKDSAQTEFDSQFDMPIKPEFTADEQAKIRNTANGCVTAILVASIVLNLVLMVKIFSLNGQVSSLTAQVSAMPTVAATPSAPAAAPSPSVATDQPTPKPVVATAVDSGAADHGDNLVDMDSVTNTGVHHQKEKTSIAGRVFDNVLYQDGGPDSRASETFDLGNNYKSFDGWVGISDDQVGNVDKDKPCEYSVALDGQVLQHGRIHGPGPPLHIHANVTGVRSLQIGLVNRAAIAGAVVSTKAP